MLIPSESIGHGVDPSSLSRRVNANSQLCPVMEVSLCKLIKKGEC